MELFMEKLLAGLLLLSSISSFACEKIGCYPTNPSSPLDFKIEIKESDDGVCLAKIKVTKEHWWKGWQVLAERVITVEGNFSEESIELYFNDQTLDDQKYELNSFNGSSRPTGFGEPTLGRFGTLYYKKNGEKKSIAYTCSE